MKHRLEWWGLLLIIIDSVTKIAMIRDGQWVFLGTALDSLRIFTVLICVATFTIAWVCWFVAQIRHLLLQSSQCGPQLSRVHQIAFVHASWDSCSRLFEEGISVLAANLTSIGLGVHDFWTLMLIFLYFHQLVNKYTLQLLFRISWTKFNIQI